MKIEILNSESWNMSRYSRFIVQKLHSSISRIFVQSKGKKQKKMKNKNKKIAFQN